MKVNSLVIQISSDKPDELKRFYSDVVGLQIDEVVGGLKVGSGHLIFDRHDAVSGANDEPARFLVNLFVDDIDSEQARLVSAGVPVIRDRGQEYWGSLETTRHCPAGRDYSALGDFGRGGGRGVSFA